MAQLQHELLEGLCGAGLQRVSGLRQGLQELQSRLQGRKVLIVLDDIDSRLIDNGTQFKWLAPGNLGKACISCRIEMVSVSCPACYASLSLELRKLPLHS